MKEKIKKILEDKCIECEENDYFLNQPDLYKEHSIRFSDEILSLIKKDI